MNNKESLINLKEKILEFISKTGKVVTTTEIAEEFKISWNTAEKYLLELTLDKKLVRLKKTGVNLWILK
jgi:predicted HTH transcriptional regulator